MTTSVLHIEGMSCEHCTRHVKQALEDIEGVKKATVDLENQSATVEHAESIGMEALAAAVEEAGYEAVV